MKLTLVWLYAGLYHKMPYTTFNYLSTFSTSMIYAHDNVSPTYKGFVLFAL